MTDRVARVVLETLAASTRLNAALLPSHRADFLYIARKCERTIRALKRRRR